MSARGLLFGSDITEGTAKRKGAEKKQENGDGKAVTARVRGAEVREHA